VVTDAAPAAMILAAGRGARLSPLTDTIPKPLLPVRGRPLIEHHVQKLARAGVGRCVINLGWLGAQIRERLGDGYRFGLEIAYSDEGWPALETGGGVRRALPLLGERPFLLINADVYSDYPYRALCDRARRLARHCAAHLVLVPNPDFHPQGDFALDGERVTLEGAPRYTFSGLSVHRPELFEGTAEGTFPLLPLWRAAAARRALSGERFDGLWSDVGTVERLQALHENGAAEPPR
jgi:MurNAc alpha-1-phosphate uridylyltransferase